jgi:Rrf2 family protein
MLDSGIKSGRGVFRMIVTQSLRYGISAMVYLAGEKGPRTANRIANKINVSRHYLSKVIGDLTKAGLLTTVRGRSGGTRLSRPAEEISMFDIFAAIHPRKAAAVEESDFGLIEVEDFLMKTQRTLQSTFNSTSVADFADYDRNQFDDEPEPQPPADLEPEVEDLLTEPPEPEHDSDLLNGCVPSGPTAEEATPAEPTEEETASE